MVPNIPPKVFSLSAVIVGYILIDDTTAIEQNAIGNWLMLVAQVICTNGFYRQVMQERGLEPFHSTESGKVSYNSYINYKNIFKDEDNKESIIMLEKIVKALREEINEIKKSM